MNEIAPYASPADAVSPPQQHQRGGDEQYSMYLIKFQPTIHSPVIAVLFTVILIVGTGTGWQMLIEPTSKPDTRDNTRTLGEDPAQSDWTTATSQRCPNAVNKRWIRKTN